MPHFAHWYFLTPMGRRRKEEMEEKFFLIKSAMTYDWSHALWTSQMFKLTSYKMENSHRLAKTFPSLMRFYLQFSGWGQMYKFWLLTLGLSLAPYLAPWCWNHSPASRWDLRCPYCLLSFTSVLEQSYIACICSMGKPCNLFTSQGTLVA